MPHVGTLLTLAANDDAPENTRDSAIATLSTLGKEADPHVAQLVEIMTGDGDTGCKSLPVRLAIIKALKALGSTTAAVQHVNSLKLIAVNNQHKGLAYAAAIALGTLGGGSESAAILAKYVTMQAAMDNFHLAMDAAQALGKLAETDMAAVKPHVKALQALMQTDDVHEDLQCVVGEVLDDMNEGY